MLRCTSNVLFFLFISNNSRIDKKLQERVELGENTSTRCSAQTHIDINLHVNIFLAQPVGTCNYIDEDFRLYTTNVYYILHEHRS